MKSKPVKDGNKETPTSTLRKAEEKEKEVAKPQADVPEKKQREFR
jgi:hypothetical protein